MIVDLKLLAVILIVFIGLYLFFKIAFKTFKIVIVLLLALAVAGYFFYDDVMLPYAVWDRGKEEMGERFLEFECNNDGECGFVVENECGAINDICYNVNRTECKVEIDEDVECGCIKPIKKAEFGVCYKTIELLNKTGKNES